MLNMNGKKERKLSSIQYFLLKIFIFIVGLLFLSFGGSLMIQSTLGTATWDVLHIGLANLTPLSIGVWVQIVGIFMISITCFIEKQRPQVGSLLNIVLIGFFLDLWLQLPLASMFDSLWERWLMLLGGILVMGVGIGMYVSSRLGAGPRDGLTLALASKLGWSVRLVRTLLESLALLSGWLLGGPVAIGTFISVFLIGPVMQTSIRFWRGQVAKWEASFMSNQQHEMKKAHASTKA